MTPRERVFAALRFEETDVIPYNISIEEGVASRLDEHYGSREQWPRFTNHFFGQGWDFLGERLDDEHARDPFGVTWKLGSIFHIVEPVLPQPSLEGYQFPGELVSEQDVAAVQEAFQQHPDEFRTYSLGLTFFERSWALRGMDGILMDFAAEPAFCGRLYDGLADLQMEAIVKLCETDVDAICLGDDFGGQKGLLMGPRHWREVIRPRLEPQYAYIRSKGKVMMIHSCGDNTEIMPDLIEMGLQIFNPTQPEAMDIAFLKREYGRDLVFDGGVGTQVTLPHGTPEQVREEVRRCVEIMAPGGGFILGTTKPIMNDVPTENAVACLEAIVACAERREP